SCFAWPRALPFPGSARAGASARAHAARVAVKRSAFFMATSFGTRTPDRSDAARAGGPAARAHLLRTSGRRGPAPRAIVRAPPEEPPMAVQNETRKAFHELLDLLREVDERFLSPEWLIQGPQDVVDGTRAVMHMLQGALVGHFEDDPEHPLFR